MRDWNEISIDQATIDRFVDAFNCGLIQLTIHVINDEERSLVRDFSMISPLRFELEAQKRRRDSNAPWFIIDRSRAL